MSVENSPPPEPAESSDTVVLRVLPGDGTEEPAPGAPPTSGFDGAPQPTASKPAVDGYEIVSELGRGGMGVVYKARQRNPQRDVALKCILAGQLASPTDVQRFRNEADAAAQLSHPGLIPIYEVGDHQGQHYFSMKLIEGGNLAQAIADGRWKTPGLKRYRAAAQLVAEIAYAVHYAHQRGVLHRDLKPANILLDDNGAPLVTDFGLAKRFQGKEAFLTGSNVIMGTPSYMAPEQALGGGSLTTAADVYSLGAILYELLAGKAPFDGPTPLSILLQLRDRKPDSPRILDRSVPRDLETICLKCLEKDPRQRYGSAEALAADLERWLNGDVIHARRAGTVEWTWKWIRRHPTQSLLGFFFVLVIVLSLGASILAWRLDEVERQQREANLQQQKDAEYARQREEDFLELQQAWREAVRGQEEADKNAKIAQAATKQVEAALYSNGIARAHFEWLGNDLARADQVLDECPEHLRDWEWNYVKRLCHPDLLTIAAVPALSLTAAAVSSDGKLIATSAGDGSVRVWDGYTGEEKHIFRQHKKAATWVAFSPDGKQLASSSLDRTVIVWDLSTEEPVFTLKGHTGGVHRVIYSADGKQLATAGLDMSIRIWNAADGSEALVLQKHTKLISSIAFSPDGKRLASASMDGTVKVWDLAMGSEVQSFKGHSDAVECVVFNSDGSKVATGSVDKTAVIWEVKSGQALQTFKGPAGRVVAIAFSPDDALLAGGSNDKVVHVWDVKTAQERFNFIGHAGEIHSVGFVGDGTRLVSSAADNSVGVWNVAVHDESYALATNYQGSVTVVGLSPSGRQLASVGQGERRVRVWDPATGRALFDLEGYRNGITALVYRPDGKRLATASADGSIKVWDLEKRQQAVTWSAGPGRSMAIGLAFSPDGSLVAGACQDGTVKIWNSESGQIHATLRGHASAGRCVAFSPDGKRLVSGAYDRTATIWDLQTGRELRTLKGHTNGPVCAVVFWADGKRIATAAGDGTARIWDAETGATLFVLKGHAMTPLTCLALNANGDRLATGSGADQSVKIWDTQTGQEMLTMKGHTGGVNCLSFSHKGNLLASGSADHTIRIWNARPLPPQHSPWLMGELQND